MEQQKLLNQVVAFARAIGVDVREGPLQRSTRVPGLDIVAGCVHVDVGELRGLGDFLHEVAHVALTPAKERHALDEWVAGTPTQEISALAWTWAVGQHLGLEAGHVFHDEIISGNGPTLRENFLAGCYVGVPMLQYWGLTNLADASGAVTKYPQMLKWTRD